GNPELMPVHLLAALVADREGIVLPVLKKIGSAAETIASEAALGIERLPKVSGAGGAAMQARLSNAATEVLEKAVKEPDRCKHAYVSTEALLLGVADQKKDPAQQILARTGATRDAILQALTAVRGNQRVTAQDPEAKFQALEKYARDLTDLARRG